MESHGKPGPSRARGNWLKVRKLLLEKQPFGSKIGSWTPLSKTQVGSSGCYALFRYSFGGRSFAAYESAPTFGLAALAESNQHRVDATGQWVWQAELLLAAEILGSRSHLKVSSVLELGAGCSGHAAFAAHAAWAPESVVITDGKAANLETVKMSVAANGWGATVAVSELLWGETEVGQKYDVVLAADCLFFECYHEALLATLRQAMHGQTLVLMVCPSRGGSMERFLEKAGTRGLSSAVLPLAAEPTLPPAQGALEPGAQFYLVEMRQL